MSEKKLTQEELLGKLSIMKGDALDYWNSPESENSYSREKIKKEATGIQQTYDQLVEIVREHFGLKNWTCTFEEYYALPEPIRNYIAALETNADPPSMVRENIYFKETIQALERKNELLIQTIKAQQKLTVTSEEIFHFHQNLMTISDDSESAQECHDREIDYIYHWLKELGVEVVE